MTQSAIEPPATRTKRPSSGLLFLAAAVVLAAVAWGWRAWTEPPEIIQTDLETTISPAFLEPADVDRLIVAYEQRVADHTDALDFRTLGFLYLEKGRLTGDVSRYLAAEEALDRALELFPSDPTARVALASALYSLHDFTGARAEAATVYDQVPRTDALAVMADADLALGNYEQAANQLDDLAEMAGDLPAVAVRQAEWARIDGRPDVAWDLASVAVEETSDVTNRRQRAWYRSFAAQMAWYLGRYDEGIELADQALADDPLSREALIVSARLLAATGEMGEAIERYEMVTETSPDPTYLAELTGLYLLEGRTAEAEATADLLEVVATLAESQGVFDRSIALYLADTAVDSPRAVTIARAELERRQDVGTWDALSWALYADGQLTEAAEASREALLLDTADARILYHGGMIAAALGDEEAARLLLERSLDLSPRFFPVDADRAADTLTTLG